MPIPFFSWPSLLFNRRESNSTIVRLFPLLLILVFSFSLNLSRPSPTQAQTTSLSIWPPLLEITAQPDQSFTQTYRLKNLGDDTVIQVALIPFEPSGDLGHVKLDPNQYQSPALSYFTLDNSSLPFSFPLPAGASQELTLKLSLPPTAPAADHYLTLLFQANTQSLITGTGSTILGSIGSNILLAISPPNPASLTLKIQDFSITKPFLDSFDSPSFTIKVNNPSPTYLKAVGHIDISNRFTRQTITLPLRSDNILKHSTRQLLTQTSWDSLFPLGHYTATLTLNPQNTTHTISQTISFWIIPYKALLVISLIFLLSRPPRNLAKYIRKYQKKLLKL